MEEQEKKSPKNTLWILLSLAAVIALICGLYFGGALPGTPGDEPGEVVELAQPTPEATPAPTPSLPVRDITLYTARLGVELSNRVLHGRLRVDYVNSSPDVLYAIRMHLYPNTVEPGCMTVSAVSLNGQDTYFSCTEDILSIPLALELDPGQSCELYIIFDIAVSRSGYGAGNGAWEFPCVLPVAAVYENGWLTEVAREDVAYSGSAEYRVIVEAAGRGVTSNCTAADEGYFTADSANCFDLTVD